MTNVEIDRYFVTHPIKIRLNIGHTAAIIILTVRHVTIVSFVRMRTRNVLKTMRAIYCKDVLFRRPRQLRVLNTLIDNNGMINRSIVARSAFQTNVFVRIFLPYSLPISTFKMVTKVARTRPSMRIVKRFLARDMVGNRLIVVSGQFGMMDPYQRNVDESDSIVRRFLGP